MNWDELKQQGSDHYKTGDTEPVDLYLSGGMFNNFALACIIKYAFRNRIDVGKIKEQIKNSLKALVELQEDCNERGNLNECLSQFTIEYCIKDLTIAYTELSKEINGDDMDKIIDYAQKLKATK